MTEDTKTSAGGKASAAVSAGLATQWQALAVRAGRTPFYVYDTAVVDAQLAALRAV